MCLPTAARVEGTRCFRVSDSLRSTAPVAKSYQPVPCAASCSSISTCSGPTVSSSSTRDAQLSARREKSRIAAQVRRKKENQALVQLLLALPVQHQQATLRKAQPRPSWLSDALHMAPNYRAASCQLSKENRSVAPEFEKAVTIRLAGSSLCLYRMLYRDGVMGHPTSTSRAVLSVHSRGLVVLIVDPKQQSVVYAPPAYANLIGMPWNTTIGLHPYELWARHASSSSASSASHRARSPSPSLNSSASSSSPPQSTASTSAAALCWWQVTATTDRGFAALAGVLPASCQTADAASLNSTGFSVCWTSAMSPRSIRPGAMSTAATEDTRCVFLLQPSKIRPEADEGFLVSWSCVQLTWPWLRFCQSTHDKFQQGSCSSASFLDLVHPDDLETVCAAVDSVTCKAPVLTCFYRLRCTALFRWVRSVFALSDAEQTQQQQLICWTQFAHPDAVISSHVDPEQHQQQQPSWTALPVEGNMLSSLLADGDGDGAAAVGERPGWTKPSVQWPEEYAPSSADDHQLIHESAFAPPLRQSADSIGPEPVSNWTCSSLWPPVAEFIPVPNVYLRGTQEHNRGRDSSSSSSSSASSPSVLNGAFRASDSWRWRTLGYLPDQFGFA